MPDHPIAIPAELLPADGRFGSGPSLVRTEAVHQLAAAADVLLGTSHRAAPIRSVVADIRERVSRLYDLPDGYEVVLGVGGATAFWDAAVFQLIEHRSQHLVFGEFSAKFAAVAAGAPHLGAPHIVERPPGDAPEPDPDADVDTFALIHNETSTGVTTEIRRPDRPGALVLVDATSAAGAVPVDPGEFDAYYWSPQKAFGSEGGLWVAIVSPSALDRIATLAGERWTPPFLDLARAVAESRINQTYNTPALATLWLLSSQLEWIEDQGGLEWAVARSAGSAALVYEWAAASPVAAPFVRRPELRSATTVTIDLDQGISADRLTAILSNNGVRDVGGYRKLGRNQVRIATFPAIEPDDIRRLLACIDFVIERLAEPA